MFTEPTSLILIMFAILLLLDQGMRLNALSATLGAVLVLQGCAAPPMAHPSISREQVQLEAHRVFARAVLHKPNPTPWESLAVSLAPLFVWELASGEQLSDLEHRQFGMPDGARSVDSSRPAIYGALEEVVLGGQSYQQIAYAWLVPSSPPAPGRMAGLRITLNSAGAPVLWEPLYTNEGAGRRVFFVAQSLESAARAHYGAPLPGRQYSIERSATDAGAAFVPRILEDGPIPMGPMVYLQAGTGRLSSILCRCMPALVENVVGTATYDVLPMEELAQALPSEDRRFQQFKDGGPGGELERVLRLPPAF
jgi:hypothetical protein